MVLLAFSSSSSFPEGASAQVQQLHFGERHHLPAGDQTRLLDQLVTMVEECLVEEQAWYMEDIMREQERDRVDQEF
ncbi:hypothetical protein Y1Q_0000079 [Alligator mississippiensis]|uniref:Uncharacterized protein n=1 Tax=Alligator mississippiensis TaxID=8496 RepID=A0A151NQE1_ALLMI|nr:hypothetical protein Y1Q_0000079 [Alligator mississippiensis]